MSLKLTSKSQRDDFGKITTRWKKSTQFRWIFLFTLDSTQEIYIPSDSYETSLPMYTHVLSLEVEMLEILKWK